MRVLSKDEYLLIKAATRSLVKSCGGIEAAADITRVGKSNLSDYGNPEKFEYFIPVDAALDLERESGSHAVTEAMAALSGGAFTPAGSEAAAPELMTAVAGIMGETAEAIKSVTASMCDGSISPREQQDIVKQIQDVIHACTEALISVGSSSNPQTKK